MLADHCFLLGCRAAPTTTSACLRCAPASTDTPRATDTLTYTPPNTSRRALARVTHPFSAVLLRGLEAALAIRGPIQRDGRKFHLDGVAMLPDRAVYVS